MIIFKSINISWRYLKQFMMYKLLKIFLFCFLIFFKLSPAHAVDIKIATLVPNQSQWMIDMRLAGERIKKETNGRVKIKFYGGGVQGTEDKVLQKIKIGQLHGGTFSATDFMKQYPSINIYGLPFIFRSWDEMRHVRTHLDYSLEHGFSDMGFITFGIAGSFSIILSNDPIKTYQDMKGKKVWLPEGDFVSYEAMRRLELSPVALPVTDVLTGLQTGLIDIATIPPEVAVALQWHTRVKYMTNIPVAYALNFLAINRRIFESLNVEDQKVVSNILSGVYKNIDIKASAESEKAIEALSNIGVINVSPESGQFQELQQIMKSFNRDMAIKGAFPELLYGQMLELLNEYRNEQE